MRPLCLSGSRPWLNDGLISNMRGGNTPCRPAGGSQSITHGLRFSRRNHRICVLFSPCGAHRSLYGRGAPRISSGAGGRALSRGGREACASPNEETFPRSISAPPAAGSRGVFLFLARPGSGFTEGAAPDALYFPLRSAGLWTTPRPKREFSFRGRPVLP